MTQRLFALSIKLQFVPKLGILGMEGFFFLHQGDSHLAPDTSLAASANCWQTGLIHSPSVQISAWAKVQLCAFQCSFPFLCETLQMNILNEDKVIPKSKFFLADIRCRNVCLFSVIIRLDGILFRHLHFTYQSSNNNVSSLFSLSQDTAPYHCSGLSMEIIWMRGFYLWGSGL